MGDVTFGVLQGGEMWGAFSTTSVKFESQPGRFGPNKCGKVLEAEVDQIYTLCVDLQYAQYAEYAVATLRGVLDGVVGSHAKHMAFLASKMFG